MKTSPIRHPKLEHTTTIHSWMVKACMGNLPAALLLGYLEGKFHVHLQSNEPKLKGWMKFQKFQIKNGCFSESWDDLDLSIDILKALDFIEVDEVGSDTRELSDGEVWIKFNALKINQWLDVYVKPTEKKMELFNFAPFLSLLFLTQAHYVEIEVEKVVEVEKIVEKEIKTRTIKIDETWIGVARDLFTFWKYMTKHPRSNLQDLYAKMIIDRLKQGYTAHQIAHGIIGLTHSDYHIKNKFDHIQYVVKASEKLDRLIGIAQKNNITEAHAITAYSQFIENRDNGALMEAVTKKGINPTTGNELK